MKPKNFLKFHKYKLYYCSLNANEFYTQLKNVIVNDLPVDSIQFETCKNMKNKISSLKISNIY